jgi:hypothetical protein
MDLSAAVDGMHAVKRAITSQMTTERTQAEQDTLSRLFEAAHELEERLMESSGSRASRNPPEPE